MGGTTIAYGLMQPGDYIGPWIFNELQAGLNLLVWTKPSASWSMQVSGDNYAGDGGEWQPTWAGTKTYAENEFDNITGRNSSIAPYAFNAGDYRTGDSYLKAMMERAMNYLTCYASDNCNRVVDYYAKATKYREEFAAFGDDVLEDVWSLWHTRTFNSGGGTACPSASPLGTISTKPTPWCAEPTAANPQKGRGYTITDKAIIIRWNIPDGFEYVAA